MILLCDVRKRTMRTQYIKQPGIVSNTIISKGPSAMSASPETRAIPALMGCFRGPSLVGMHNHAPEKRRTARGSQLPERWIALGVS